MTTFTAVVTAHAESPSRILGNLMYQTRKPDETICYVSDFHVETEDFPHVRFVQCENRNDWGHEKRAQGLVDATGDWLGFFNADDSYTLDYLERMLAKTVEHPDAVAVFCGWNTYPQCEFKLGSSTSGNFIVRRDIGLQAGYVERQYDSDGHFINRVAQLGHVPKVDAVLYFHNEAHAS